MNKAIVLGAREGNIGGAIAQLLHMHEWEVVEDACVGGLESDHDYEVPSLGAHAAADALVVTLGRTMVEPFVEAPEADIEDTIRACLTLPLLAAKEYMAVRGTSGGRVVFIGSYAHNHPITYATAYCAAKAGLDMAARTLAWELGDQGYAFFTVHPYHVPGTPMWEWVQDRVQETRGWSRQEADEYARKDLKQDHMLTPQEIARIVAFLLEEPAAAWLSGAGLDLYGGVR